MTDNTERPDETRFWENVAHYTAEQWGQMLAAFVEERDDDPLLIDGLKRFGHSPDNLFLPEDEHGFLHGAIMALGETTYRRAMLPLAPRLWAAVSTHTNDANLRRQLDAFEAWCVAPKSISDDVEAFLSEGRGFLGLYPDDDGRAWACSTALWHAFNGDDGGGLEEEGAEGMMSERRQRRPRPSRPGLHA